MRTIRAHKRIHRGKVRYLVIEPPAKGKPRKAKWFRTKEKADAHADIVNTGRQEHIADLYLLDRQSQSLLLAAFQKAGTAQAVLDAVNAAGNPIESKTVREVVDAIMADREGAKRSEVYTTQLRWTFNSFASGRNKDQINAVTTQNVRDWLASLSGSPDAQRAYITRIRGLFKFAIDNKWLRENPAKIISLPDRSQAEPRIFTPEHAEKILKAVAAKDRSMIAYFALGFFAGLRPSEIGRLEKEHLTPDLIRVTLKVARKKKEVRNIPINETLRAWLDVSDGVPIPDDWRRRFGDLSKGFEVKWIQDGMRHSFVTYMNELHGWQETVSQAGHSLAMMVEHYRALTTKAEAKKFWNIRP